MLLSVFGPPSALMYGGLNLVRNLTELGLGAHKLANANTTDELRKTLSELGTAQEAKVVFYSDMPDAELCSLFIKTRAPIVLFVDNFDDVVGYVSASRDMSLFDSFRLASRSFCALEPVIRSDLVLKFDGKAYPRALREVLADIGAFFGRKLSQDDRDQIATSLVKEGSEDSLSEYLFRTFPHASAPGTALQQMPPEDRRLADLLSQPYSAMASGHPLKNLDWPISMLFDSAAPDRTFSGRVDLLGPARFLAYGPYLHLTSGKWCADVVFEIQENHSG